MKRLPQVIDREDFERVLAQPSRRAPTGIRNAAMLAAMWDAGLRVAEVCDLAPEDVVGRSQELRVRRGKGGKDRYNLGVPRSSWALLDAWAQLRPSSRFFFCTLAGNRVEERYVRAMVARYAARAAVLKPTPEGPRPINPHMLRHSYATRLIQAGVPIHDVQRALGHESLSTTQRYLHVNDAQLAQRLRSALDADPDSVLRRLVRQELEHLMRGA
jgi:site-specific recombinase XerD